MPDGGVSVGSYDDLQQTRGQPIDRNPSMPCKICGESFHWQDYWKDRILSAENPKKAPYWCDDCEREIQAIRRRRSQNADLSQWGDEDGA